MTRPAAPSPLLQGLDKADYHIDSLDDEIRVDRLCIDLLRHLNQDLVRRNGKNADQAGELCHGADYFLREFIVADRRMSLFEVNGDHVRQFAGHWYIIRTPEPSPAELAGILAGTAEFFRFLARQGLTESAVADDIERRCGELDYYRRRIDDYWAIEGEGYSAWRQACPLEPGPDAS